MKTLCRSSILFAVLAVAVIFVVSCAEDNSAVPANGNGQNGGTNGAGEGGIVVTSLTANRGQQGVVIPVLMTNDFPLRGIVLPLRMRQIDDGAFITSLKLSFGDRLPLGGVLSDIKFSNQYYSEDGHCKGRSAGGFATIATNDTLAHDISSSSVGILFSRHRLVGDNLAPGTDKTGSFLLTADMTNTAGRFEIDTTCVNPSNHLMLTSPANEGVIPSFTKGMVTIQ